MDRPPPNNNSRPSVDPTTLLKHKHKHAQEVRKVIDYRVKELGAEGGKLLAVCLSSRRNMCIHERVMEEVRV